mmetsp:Transcript_27256/g.40980  ORF Transcript_27256/g.40980 Transcript_27256/m.40980 type:complete len:85 (+) Transcript_27256:135-389(+)
MSADTGAGEENTSFCASCGNAEVDDIKLKDCNDCKSVRYCSDKCQREHRPNQVQDCEKRATDFIHSACKQSSRGLSNLLVATIA